VDGIPVLLPPAVVDDHKRQQAAYTDEATRGDFEETRPYGTPRLYRQLMNEKLERALRGFAGGIEGWNVLVVCGGSGMDGSLLAERGAQVVSSDISLGAARRVASRSTRFDQPLAAVVADVERLPFADRSFDLVFVHDGLHHLEDPRLGIAEMARVAARAVSITEPAVARATQLAVRLGLALQREEAGNVVRRLTLAEISGELGRAGLRTVHAGRYAMYYKHHPGRAVGLLSGGAADVTMAALRVANRAAGRFGNKLSVQALR
jgi:SAM-dependent methyltransferase